jgi:hypothetical protein
MTSASESFTRSTTQLDDVFFCFFFFLLLSFRRFSTSSGMVAVTEEMSAVTVFNVV